MRLFVYLLLILIFANACNDGVKNRKIKALPISLQIVRLDDSLAAWKNEDRVSVEKSVTSILKAHALFFEAYNTSIIKVGSAYSAHYYENILEFLKYPIFDELQEDIGTTFKDVGFIKQKLEPAFGRIKTLYPEKLIPYIYTYNGGFNQSIVLVENGVGVGLDKYLGVDCKYYKQMGMQQFLIDKMYPEKIPSDIIIGYLQGEFEYNFKDENLLAKMLHTGRIMYLADLLLPEVQDSVLWGYSGRDFEFLESSENDIWLYFVDNKMLFDSDYMVTKKILGDGPFTSYFSKESPSRIGIWMGYRIVEQYMKLHQEITIVDLMQENDYQHIMNKAKYNP